MCQWANSWAGIKPTALLSVFDKENSIEFLLDLLHYIYSYYHGYAPYLPQSSCYWSADLFVTCYDCDSCDIIILWLLSHLLWLYNGHMILSHPSNKEKKRKRKEILNNNLAVLPSHDIMTPSSLPLLNIPSSLSCHLMSSMSYQCSFLYIL